MQEAEWQTRKQRIDTRLRALNPPWQILAYRAGLDVARLSCHAVTEFPTDNGPADYALFVNGRSLGILEQAMVKHAVAPQAPLLAARERVNRAMDRYLAGRKLSTEQMQWLSLVREHLVTNLSMDEEDFDLTPLLERRGGKAKARKVFGELAPLVARLNEAVAA